MHPRLLTLVPCYCLIRTTVQTVPYRFDSKLRIPALISPWLFLPHKNRIKKKINYFNYFDVVKKISKAKNELGGRRGQGRGKEFSVISCLVLPSAGCKTKKKAVHSKKKKESQKWCLFFYFFFFWRDPGGGVGELRCDNNFSPQFFSNDFSAPFEIVSFPPPSCPDSHFFFENNTNK